MLKPIPRLPYRIRGSRAVDISPPSLLDKWIKDNYPEEYDKLQRLKKKKLV